MKYSSKLLIVEPSFHVSKEEFLDEVYIAKEEGFEIIEKGNRNIFLSRSVLLKIADR